MQTTSFARLLVATGALALTAVSSAEAQDWVAAWSSSMQSASPETWSMTDATIRRIARTTVAGDQVRIRLENTFGD